MARRDRHQRKMDKKCDRTRTRLLTALRRLERAIENDDCDVERLWQKVGALRLNLRVPDANPMKDIPNWLKPGGGEDMR